MKYIRTENHIYLIQKDISYGGNRIYKIYNHDFSIIGNDFKVADTIEELCDEFVCEWFDKKVNRYRHAYCSFKIGQSKELYRRDIPLPPDVDFEIYAGIWIKGEGLTYVAKMDESGDLELI